MLKNQNYSWININTVDDYLKAKELEFATDFNPNLSVNETDPKFGNYYEMIEFYANIRVSKDNPYFGFYENPYKATLQRFTEW